MNLISVANSPFVAANDDHDDGQLARAGEDCNVNVDVRTEANSTRPRADRLLLLCCLRSQQALAPSRFEFGSVDTRDDAGVVVEL